MYKTVRWGKPSILNFWF